MAIYAYEDVIKELIDNGVISGRDVFDVGLYPNEYILRHFFQFCQENLSEKCVDYGYNIQPSKFYFTNRFSVNACAAHGEEYYVIKVNIGAMQSLYDLFCNNEILSDPELADYKVFNELLEQNRDVSLTYLMYQTAIQFTYYHELGHLIQFSNQNGIKAMLTEQYIDNSDGYDALKHILEYDADQHAGNSVSFHIMDFWDHLREEDKTDENMKKLVTVSLVGILGYIFFLWNTLDEDLYFQKYDHPHPLIRIFWIMGVIINTTKTNFTSLQQNEIIAEALRVLDVYFRHKNKGSVHSRFMQPLVTEYESIMDYCDNLITSAEHIPYLVVNTVHNR